MDEVGPLLVLRTLEEHDVGYVVIDGWAALAHGSDAPTRDIDVCYQRSEENHRRLVGGVEGTRFYDSAFPA